MFSSWKGRRFKVGARTYNAVNILGHRELQLALQCPLSPATPPGWNAMVGQTCRASDGMAFTFSDGYTANLGNLTNITDQSTALDFAAVAGSDCTTGAHNCTLNVHNAVTMGFSNPFSAFLPRRYLHRHHLQPLHQRHPIARSGLNPDGSRFPSQPNTVSTPLMATRYLLPSLRSIP